MPWDRTQRVVARVKSIECFPSPQGDCILKAGRGQAGASETLGEAEKSGLRSYKACLKLHHKGFENVKNIDRGMLCWCYDMESKGEKR